MFTAADVSMEELIAGARRHHFNDDEPAGSTANFAAACEVVCEARLPRRASLASVCVSACHKNARLVHLRAGATSSYAGREYLERLARDTALALELFNLMSDAARLIGLETDEA
mgnify:CR=1 FL=1